ncbi:hypothetical protein OESDEN_08908 [Oesophagostomum dentatum]|uniref:Uncharacterized protein n=1 Tax=Oesophagostomum dentatum TaxID=61180 RepID=A0A0B1T616_OESDE|nr:hypothetical protein OESDEN_08908 [Oesophagostomum dentatum]
MVWRRIVGTPEMCQHNTIHNCGINTKEIGAALANLGLTGNRMNARYTKKKMSFNDGHQEEGKAGSEGVEVAPRRRLLS